MRHYKAMINKLDNCVNGYNYRIDIFKVDYERVQTYYNFSTYAETQKDAEELANYYNGKPF